MRRDPPPTLHQAMNLIYNYCGIHVRSLALLVRVYDLRHWTPIETLLSLRFYKSPFGLLNQVETIATASNYYLDPSWQGYV